VELMNEPARAYLVFDGPDLISLHASPEGAAEAKGAYIDKSTGRPRPTTSTT
jgi:hypothetical protein